LPQAIKKTQVLKDFEHRDSPGGFDVHYFAANP